MHWGALGELTFQTGFSPRSLEVKQQFRVVPQKVINHYPQLDNLGEDIRVLNLQIILNQVLWVEIPRVDWHILYYMLLEFFMVFGL